MTFEPITSQDAFDTMVRKRLERQGDRHRDERLALVVAHAHQLATMRTRLREAEVRAVAAELGFINPADALVVAEIGDEIEVTDSGQVDVVTIRQRLTALAEERPYFLQDTQPRRSA